MSAVGLDEGLFVAGHPPSGEFRRPRIGEQGKPASYGTTASTVVGPSILQAGISVIAETRSR